MKSVTLPRSDDKRIVRSALPSSKIFTAAVARLYIAFPNTNEWKYSGIWGAVVFCRDKHKKDSFFIRMVDMENERGIVWEQELFYDFEYIKDTSFFHTFLTDDCLAGILFVHQGEADAFYEKVLNRDLGRAKEDSKLRESKSNGVGLVKYTPGKGFTVENNDPEILEILSELENIEDFSAADVERNQDFIQDFIQQYKANKNQTINQPARGGRRAPPPPPPPSRRGTNKSNLPPPPIPPTNKRHIQSPAPPPPPMPSRNTASSPPPPPPPNRGVRQTSFANNGTSSAPPPPPPPPPPPMSTSAPPAPPPPPPSGFAQTSSPKPTAASTPSPSGRNDLMAAIRGTGGFGSLKKGGSLRNVPQTNNRPMSATSTDSSNTNASMASSLAAVLQQRKAAMQSDGEEDEDDDDWK